MAGAIAIIVVLAIFPVLIAMSGGVASAILGARAATRESIASRQ